MAASSTTPSPPKKRVRFEEDEETRQVKQRVMQISFPKSSLLTTNEKTCYWMQPEDHRHTLHDVMTLMHDCHQVRYDDDSNNGKYFVPFAQYAEALALTFTLCDTPPLEQEEDKDDHDDEPPLWDIRDSRFVAQLALWASHHTPTRGVESKILPGLQQERQIRRSRAIQGVLEAQRRFCTVSAEEKISRLGAVSRILSHSAKQFATALAVVDGTQAYLEYTEDADCSATPENEMRTKDKVASVTPTRELEGTETNSWTLQLSTTASPQTVASLQACQAPI